MENTAQSECRVTNIPFLPDECYICDEILIRMCFIMGKVGYNGNTKYFKSYCTT